MTTHLDLFSGIGGFALAARWAGLTTIQFCEIEPYCRAVLAKNFPGVPVHDDITTFDGQPFRGRVDLLTGGFPCQDISAAGKGAGLDGARSGLWFELLRVIGECRPQVALIENVPALRTRGADAVLEGLEEAGYAAEAFVVGADDVGASHRRKRVWIVAYAGHDERPQRDSTPGVQHASDRGLSLGEPSPHRSGMADTPEIGLRGRAHDEGCRAAGGDGYSGDGATLADTTQRGIRQRGRCEPREHEQGGAVQADAERDVQRPRLRAGTEAGEWRGGLRDGGCDVADAYSIASSFRSEQPGTNGPGLRGAPYDSGAIPRFPPARTDYRSWAAVASVDAALMPAVERPLRRVAARLPGRLDGVTGNVRNHRLKALGNAIVPQVAYTIIRAIQETQP